MKNRTPKKPKREGPDPRVTTASFDRFIEFTATAQKPPIHPLGNGHAKSANGKPSKKAASAPDRGRLRDIEARLNNCLSLAGSLETKQAAKLIQLLTEARERAIRLRG
jgi:hypothetical protein